ncbi:hypothetical protein FVB32_03580 [Flagellimonas hymeniacidonis]|uniref:Lipoprotein n=1 Tax=Flagellimonas hymeniacidonis TaxID=2603628 RepID=A0A5C8V822_9FLAO|nr:hypothetical protein [Flagellimonas hymeniacidonis]TXN37380.1 hypothetical protein FVB32_03580 [Flagellimonas hymeniacidonis]
MRKLSCIILVFVTLLSCKGDGSDAQNTADGELPFSYQKMPKKLAMNSEATTLVEEWAEFKALSSSLDVLYKARNNEDLILAIDDLIEKEKLLEKAVYPELFDKMQIKSRQRVFKTYLLKVKASILNNRDSTEPTIEMLEAYNAFRKQFNVLVNSQLDKNLILNEE